MFAKKICITYKRVHMTYHQNSSNQLEGPMVSKDHRYLRHDDIFHDWDKGPKHGEMFQTKCQPKIGTDKMPTTKKSGQNANLWLAFCPVGILSHHRVSSIGVMTKCLPYCHFYLEVLHKNRSFLPDVEEYGKTSTSGDKFLFWDRDSSTI